LPPSLNVTAQMKSGVLFAAMVFPAHAIPPAHPAHVAAPAAKPRELLLLMSSIVITPVRIGRSQCAFDVPLTDTARMISKRQIRNKANLPNSDYNRFMKH